MKVMCSISTRGRYDDYLPLAISAVINQTRKVDKLVIFDDNDNPVDLRTKPQYTFLFNLMKMKNIDWSVIYGKKKGQHHNHEIANFEGKLMGFDWIWRVDDDNIPEPNVLENLCKYAKDDVGAIGGSVLFSEFIVDTKDVTGKIERIDLEQNIQWGIIDVVKEVDHLHCSFMYRPGIVHYNLGLSRVAHREETLFTFQLKQKGYKLLVVPNAITWHGKSMSGGIRMENNKELYDHDEFIFRNILSLKDKTIVVLDNGMGDHIIFKHVLPYIKNPEVFSCYPEIVPGRSIGEARHLFGDIDNYNLYKFMAENQWKESVEKAYCALYGVVK